MKKLLLLSLVAFVGCSGPPNIPQSKLAKPDEVPGGLEILSLTREQALAIRKWEESNVDPTTKPEEYFKFVESRLRSDQKAALRSLAKGDSEAIAAFSIEILVAASKRFRVDCGQLPSKAEDLSKDPGVEGWKGPYFKKIVDPWGIPYQFEVVDEDLEIRSFGPDQKNETDDDIVNQ